jgi:hypothetical protein
MVLPANQVTAILVRYFTISGSVPDEIDGALAQDARDLKTILFNHKDTLDSLKAAMFAKLSSEGCAYVLENSGLNAYRILLRNILTIGSELANGKQFREIFGAIAEKIVDVSLSFKWSSNELGIFLTTLVSLFCNERDIGLHGNVQKRFGKSFTRIVDALKLSAAHMMIKSETRTTI